MSLKTNFICERHPFVSSPPPPTKLDWSYATLFPTFHFAGLEFCRNNMELIL